MDGGVECETVGNTVAFCAWGLQMVQLCGRRGLLPTFEVMACAGINIVDLPS